MISPFNVNLCQLLVQIVQGSLPVFERFQGGEVWLAGGRSPGLSAGAYSCCSTRCQLPREGKKVHEGKKVPLPKTPWTGSSAGKNWSCWMEGGCIGEGSGCLLSPRLLGGVAAGESLIHAVGLVWPYITPVLGHWGLLCYGLIPISCEEEGWERAMFGMWLCHHLLILGIMVFTIPCRAAGIRGWVWV